MNDDQHDPDDRFDNAADNFVEALLACVGGAAVLGIILLLLVLAK